VLFGEVVDVAVDDAYVSFTRESLDNCAPLMRSFNGQNPDFPPVNPHTDVYNPYVEDYRQYIVYDLDHIRMRNTMIMKYMIQNKEIHEIIKGLVHHGG